MVLPGMCLSPTRIPSGGVIRWVPEGTGGWTRSVSFMTASSSEILVRFSCAKLGKLSNFPCRACTSLASWARWKKICVRVAATESLPAMTISCASPCRFQRSNCVLGPRLNSARIQEKMSGCSGSF